MTYQDQLDDTATATAEQVLAAVAAYEAGNLTSEALAAIVAAFIAAGNTAAASLADLSLAAALTSQLGTSIAPLGITRPADDAERLTTAALTMLTLENPTTERWERLARSEVLEAGARGYSGAVKASQHVTGWRRGLSSSACQLCRWWHRDGRVWPDDHTMPTHKGCTCSQLPTT